MTTVPGGDWVAIQGAWRPLHPHPAFLSNGLVNNSQHGLAIVQQRYESAK
jgi:hypothetical protein